MLTRCTHPILLVGEGPERKRARDEDSTAESHGDRASAAAASSARYPDSGGWDGGGGDDDDDDDDDNVDLSAYDLGDEDKAREDQASSAPPPPQYQPSREELLLMREAADSGRADQRSRKTFFIDDNLESQEKSAGKERRQDLKRTKFLARQMMGR